MLNIYTSRPLGLKTYCSVGTGTACKTEKRIEKTIAVKELKKKKDTE